MLKSVGALVMIASSPTATAQEPTARDIQVSSAAMANYELAIVNEGNLVEAAKAVCRIEFSETIRGLSLTANAIKEYKGRHPEVITFMCNGYLQGATDVITWGQKPPPSILP